MAGMDITPEREKQVLFTTRTMTTLPCLWVSKANTPVLTAERQKSWRSERDDTPEVHYDKHPEITTVPYDSYQNAKLDCKTVVSTAYLVTPQW